MSSQPRDGTIEREPTGGVSIGRLRQELSGDATEGTGGEDRRSAELLESTLAALFPEETVSFENETVRDNLDEVLLTLVALSENGSHGKGLMDDLDALFGADLSPGTVYPRLHEMETEGVLDVRELVRTKEYHVNDEETARGRIRTAMRQHLALGLFLKSALEEF